jgi:hypothetical protein
MRADREFAYEKPEGVRRIVCVGDSFTMGYEVDAKDCFTNLLEQKLRENGKNVETLNAGVSGFSNAEACIYLENALLRYAPDVVVLSFYSNDLHDNVRTGIFALEGHTLVARKDRYVPAGSLANFLNSNWFFSWLSERSNAFVFVREKVAVAVKKAMVERNDQEVLSVAGQAAGKARGLRHRGLRHRRRLAAAILQRVQKTLQERGIDLVVQVIPSQPGGKDSPLEDNFPVEEFDASRTHMLHMKPVLDPFVGKELLYWQRSHAHWTPFSHGLSADALSRLILERKLLD